MSVSSSFFPFKIRCWTFDVRCSSFLRAAFLQDDTLASSSFSPFNVRCWTFDVRCSFFLSPPGQKQLSV
jgi:hypothetical protein